MNSAPVTAIDPRWVCGLLQMGDTFYPTGAYAHSFGLEGLVEAGVVHDRESLREYLAAAVLPGLARTELPLVVHAYRAYQRNDWSLVERLSVLSSALRTAREARAASDAIGRQRTELLVRLRRSERARLQLEKAAAGHWPFSSALALALESVELGAPVEWALGSAYYGSVAGTLAAAMKIIRLGQNAAQTLLTEALDASPEHFAVAQSIGLEDLGWFNPWLDIASARHEHAAARLFIS